MHLPALTSLRFFACIVVVLYHVALPALQGRAHEAISIGFVGVSLFFVLSGVIMTYVYGRRSNSSPKAYWFARFARLYPIYLLGLLLGAPAFLDGVLQRGDSLLTLFLAPTLLQSWLPLTACKWNCPGWSLSVEVLFYFIFPLIILPLILKTKTSTLVIIALVVYIIALLPGLLYHEGEGTPLFIFLTYNPLVHIPAFLVGAVAGRTLLDHSVPTRWRVPLLTVGFLGIIATVIWASHIPYLSLHNGLMIPIWVALILGLANLKHGLLNSKGLLLLGNASYSLYIIHVPLWDLSTAVARRIGLETGSWLFILPFLVMAVLTSILAFRLIEQPAQRALLNWQANRRTRVPVVSGAED